MLQSMGWPRVRHEQVNNDNNGLMSYSERQKVEGSANHRVE